MTTTASAALIAAVSQLPVIVADNMLYAQGYKLSDGDRAVITTVKDALAALGFERRVSLKVVDLGGATIGSLLVP